MITSEDLRAIPTFQALDDASLTWLAEHAEERVLAVGESAFETDTSADHMIIALKGAMQLTIRQGTQWRVFDTFRAGSISGVLPYSRMTHFRGRALALEPTRLALIHKDDFPEMLYRIPALGQALIAMMSDRVRTSERVDQQREKMMALGKLSAGLAHELNNPAAAVQRATVTLTEQFEKLPTLVTRMARHGLEEHQITLARGFCHLHAASISSLSALERGEREDNIADWLDDHGVDESWMRAPTLVDAGLTAEDLDRTVATLPEAAVPDVIAWLETSLATNRLLDEITEAATRISNLVASVKDYSHMDRASDKQPTDLRDGLDSTLTMLQHKLKKKAIHVERRYDEALPLVEAYPGELNQVWTNLIDNAIDAVDEGGHLQVEAYEQGHFVFVRIIDNGKGIPDDIRSRIFEPFFTTKGVGEGTGLGLDIVQRIITRQHEGDIRVDSEPGNTAFTISLPIKSVIS